MIEVKNISHRVLIVLAGFLFLNGCATGPPLPPANLQDPGWRTLQGQAVWRPDKKAEEISGELLVAFSNDGQSFLQFTKTPFPLVIVQRTPTHWQLQSALRKKVYRAPGSPPSRIIWFELMQRLQNKPPPKSSPWRWEKTGNDWKLQHVRTGEILEGYLGP